ncbi:hypothetical protein AB0N17_30860 [Streptomyces sp. NPDC051133]|uniref:hypothetical protein n=1 Tax=Streptomyces sp. NPDC051133 TaxID=3155521 RepID=UPI0034266329
MLVVTDFGESLGQVFGSPPGVQVIGAQRGGPGPVEVIEASQDHRCAATVHEMEARFAGCEAGVGSDQVGRGDRQQVGQQVGPGRPSSKIPRPTWVCGGQEGAGAACRCGTFLGAELIFEDGRGETVQMQAATRYAGQQATQPIPHS